MNWVIVVVLLWLLIDIQYKVDEIERNIKNINFKLGDTVESINYFAKHCDCHAKAT